MNTDEAILAVLGDMVLDDPERGLTTARFSSDPTGWQAAAEDWGVSTIPVHQGPDAAQSDAERCLAALVAAGWHDQADAEVSATFDADAAAWRGAIQLNFGLLPVEYGDSVVYGPAKPKG